MYSSSSFDIVLKGFRATLDKPRKVYIKFSFDGSFKRDRTHGNQRAAEPTWPDEFRFRYHTERMQDMRLKRFRVVVMEDIFGPDIPFGVAETDLHNIACGPPLQDLPLLDGLHTVGRIFFELQMIEHRAVEIAHHNLFFSFDDAYAIRGPTIFKMWCRKDDMRDGVAMPFVASIPDPRRCTIDTSFMELYTTGMNYALCQDATVLAQGVMNFSDTYSFIEGEPIPIVVELTGLVNVTMEATVSFSNMPRYVQMIAGVHSDTGIRGGALFVDNLPEKPYCHVEGITVTARPVIEAQTRTASNAATAASLVAAGGVSLLPDYSLRTGPSAELLRLHGWTEAFDPTIGCAVFSNFVTGQKTGVLPTKRVFEVALHSRPFGMHLEPNDTTNEYYMHNDQIGKGAVVTTVTPVSEAAYGGVDTGCIVTHVNGVAAPDIFELMDMLTGYPLPIRLTFLNPFAIPGPVSAPTAVCAPPFPSAPPSHPPPPCAPLHGSVPVVPRPQRQLTPEPPSRATRQHPASVAPLHAPASEDFFDPFAHIPSARPRDLSHANGSLIISPVQVHPPPLPTASVATSTRPVLPPGWSAVLDASTGRTHYSNTILMKTAWEIPKIQQFEVELSGRPFGLDLGSNDDSCTFFTPNAFEGRGAIVKSVLPTGTAHDWPLIEPGCIITHVDGQESIGDFDALTATLMYSELPMKIRFLNPFAAPEPSETASSVVSSAVPAVRPSPTGFSAFSFTPVLSARSQGVTCPSTPAVVAPGSFSIQLARGWSAHQHPTTGVMTYSNAISMKVVHELPSIAIFDVSLTFRPFGLDLEANVPASALFVENGYVGRGAIIRAVLASGSAMSYADVIEPGCIITHVNGRDAASFDSVLEALRHSALPLQLTLCNPFAIGSQH